MHASARRLAPSARRRGESGVSIVLAMLVLFVLIVVITELRFDASVELDQSRATAEGTRMRMVAEAAFLQARTSLLMDAEAASGDEESADAGDMGGLLGENPLDPDNADDEGSPEENSDDGTGSGLGTGTGGDVSDVIARTDSRLDDWQDSVAMQPPVGNDFTLWVEVVDEDSKLNLLGLWAKDQAQRDAWREVLRVLLDHAFDDSSLDLSWTDATEILENLDDWVKGQRGSFDPVPKPPLKKTNAEDDALAAGTSSGTMEDEQGHDYPLTLGELLLVGGLKPEHLHGFVEDDHFYPGLEEYLTVWSQLELKPEPPMPDEFGDSPFTQGSLFDKELSDTGGGLTDDEEEAGSDDVTEAQASPTNDGLVNINTAPMVVLRALAPEDIPTTFLERLVEFRGRIDELRKEGKIYGTGSLFDDPVAGSDSGEDEGDGDGASLFEDDDEDPTKYVFETPDEVVAKVEEEFGIELAVDPDIETQFVTRLAVSSQVFTIKVLVRDDKTGRRASYRGVIWRMTGGETPLALSLLPLEPFYDARRLSDFPEDMAEQSEARFERWTPEGYVDPNRPR